VARITLQGTSFMTSAAADTMTDVALEMLRQSIPAARVLPLLQAIAMKKAGPLVLAYLDDVQLAVEVAPC
jgi:hypothetical protein